MVVWCLKVYIYRCRYNYLGWFGIWDFGRDEVVGSIGFFGTCVFVEWLWCLDLAVCGGVLYLEKNGWKIFGLFLLRSKLFFQIYLKEKFKLKKVV